MKNQVAVKKKTESIEKAIQPFMELQPADIKRYVCSSATDLEVGFFIRFCLSRRLNPFTREAYLIKYANQPAYIVVDWEKRIQPMTLHPQYDGFEAGLILERKGEQIRVDGEMYFPTDKILGGWCRVHIKDRSFPVEISLAFHEWSQGQALWKSRPGRMIYKTAIVHGHRAAFPGIDIRSIPEEDVELTSEVLNIQDESPDQPAIAPIEKDPTKRRAKFFKYMKDEHNLSDSEKIRERVSKVIDEEVSSLNKFLFNDNQFMVFMDRDKTTSKPGHDPAKDLFGADMEEKPYEKQ